MGGYRTAPPIGQTYADDAGTFVRYVAPGYIGRRVVERDEAGRIAIRQARAAGLQVEDVTSITRQPDDDRWVIELQVRQ